MYSERARDMKGYVITVCDIGDSVAAAERCIESGRQYGVDVCKFEAADPSSFQAEMESNGLFPGQFKPLSRTIDAWLPVLCRTF